MNSLPPEWVPVGVDEDGVQHIVITMKLRVSADDADLSASRIIENVTVEGIGAGETVIPSPGQALVMRLNEALVRGFGNGALGPGVSVESAAVHTDGAASGLPSNVFD